MTAEKPEKVLEYNWYFISTVGSSGSRLGPLISQAGHVKIQALITYHLISKDGGEFTQFILNITFLKMREMNPNLSPSDNT